MKRVSTISLVVVVIVAFAGNSLAGTYSGGSGTESDPYQINTAAQLDQIGYYLNYDDLDKHFILTADIDLSAYTGDTFHIIGSPGGHNYSFMGTFDGNNHIISNFTWITGDTREYVGLFGYVDGEAVIKNVTLVGVNIDVPAGTSVGGLVGYITGSVTISNCSVSGTISGYSSVGGLLGGEYIYNRDNGTIQDCHVSATVQGSGSVGGIIGTADRGTCQNSDFNGNVIGGSWVGGLAGWSSHANISNCYATGSVSGNSVVGGLVGNGNQQNTIENCYATATVQGSGNYVGGLMGTNIIGTCLNSYATGTVTGNDYVGGLVGGNHSNSYLTHCYATGNVSGNNKVGGLVGENDEGNIMRCYALGNVNGFYWVGGLAGYNSGDIWFSYAIGDVTGTNNVGGLVGYNDLEWISNCYSASDVSGVTYVGGLVGYSYCSVIIDCFWDSDIQTHGVVESIGYNNTNCSVGWIENIVGKSTAEMQTQASFTDYGWDFLNESTNGTNDIWRMCVDGIDYPHLSWEYSINGDFACPDGVGTDDLLSLSSNWLNSEELDTGFSYPCDPTFDGVTNLSDYVVLAEHWLETL